MSIRLRDWANTGDYSDEPPEPPAPARGPRSPSAWRLENAPVAALVPIGIVMGTLMALAFVARLVLLPLHRAAGPRRDREE